jgi:hypothetical protein
LSDIGEDLVGRQKTKDVENKQPGDIIARLFLIGAEVRTPISALRPVIETEAGAKTAVHQTFLLKIYRQGDRQRERVGRLWCTEVRRRQRTICEYRPVVGEVQKFESVQL